MKSKKLLATLLAVSLVATSLAGCGDKKDNKEKKAANGVESKDDKGSKDKQMDAEQSYNSASTDPATMDPGRGNTNTEWGAQSYVFEGLLASVPQKDGPDKVEGALAETWEINPEGTKYTFHLRKNLKWSDGKSLTAKDFEYSWKRVVDPATGSQNQGLLNGIVKNATEISDKKKKADELGVKAEDDNTFVVELEKPCSYFLDLAYHPVLKPVKKEDIDKFGKKFGTNAEATIGCGAYIVKEWMPKNKMVLEKNENYWDKDKINLKTVTFKTMKDKNARMQAFQTGEVDAVTVLDPTWINKFKADPKNNYIVSGGKKTDFLIMNTDNKFLSNKKVRQALSIATDREDYCNTFNKDLNTPAYCLTPPAITVDGKKYAEEMKIETTLKDLVAKGNAKQLLKDGLKELGMSDDPSKVTIRFYPRGNEELNKQEAEWFQQMWKEKLGINVKVELMDYNIMYDKMEKSDFDIGFGGWFADWNDPSNFLGTMDSKSGNYKYSKWVNKEYDELVKKGVQTADPTERMKIYAQAEKILMEESAIIPVYNAKDSVFRKTYIKDRVDPNFGFYNMKGVYIQGKK